MMIHLVVNASKARIAEDRFGASQNVCPHLGLVARTDLGHHVRAACMMHRCTGPGRSGPASSLRLHVRTEQNALFLHLLAESASRASPPRFLHARLFEKKLG